MRDRRLGRIAAAGLAAIGWTALAIQLWLMSHAVTNYFSFFTIETNIIVATVLTLGLAGRRVRASMLGAAAAYIAIVGIVYAVLLRNLWNPAGMQKVADVMLHDIVPVGYVVYWLAFGEHVGLKFSDAARWLIFPLIYLAYTLARGAITGWYPYPFINVAKLGYLRVFVNAGGLILFFLLMSSLVVWIDRRLTVRRTS